MDLQNAVQCLCGGTVRRTCTGLFDFLALVEKRRLINFVLSYMYSVELSVTAGSGEMENICIYAVYTYVQRFPSQLHIVRKMSHCIFLLSIHSTREMTLDGVRIHSNMLRCCGYSIPGFFVCVSSDGVMHKSMCMHRCTFVLAFDYTHVVWKSYTSSLRQSLPVDQHPSTSPS